MLFGDSLVCFCLIFCQGQNKFAVFEVWRAGRQLKIKVQDLVF